jgi:type IV secretion system protein VirB2
MALLVGANNIMTNLFQGAVIPGEPSQIILESEAGIVQS